MFSGLIDEVKLQNKALTGQEILTEYESVKTLHGGTVPLIPNEDIDEDLVCLRVISTVRNIMQCLRKTG